MKKSRILSLLLASVMALSLFGCGNKAQTTTTNSGNKEDSKEVVVKAVNTYFADMPKDSYLIASKDFAQKVKSGEELFIVDSRKAEDYGKAHVKGAVNIPWGKAMGENLDKLPKDKEIYVYCYTGQTAGQTVAVLNMAGFKAKSVVLGYDLGISKQEAAKDINETKVNDFKKVETLDMKPELKKAVTDYFTALDNIKDPMLKNNKISESDLKKLVDKKDNSLTLLDVRKAEDFTKSHIDKSVNIPFGKGMNEKFSTLPKDKKVVVICYTGQKAAQTVAGLRLLGYDAVSLNAGMGTKENAPSGWMNKGLPVTQ